MGAGILAFFLAVAVTAPPDRAAALAEAARRAESGDVAGALAAYRALLGDTSPADADQAEILTGLATVETRSGDYAASVRHATEAARIFASRGETGRRGAALNTAGLAHLYAGDYLQAGRAFQEAIDAFAAAGDESRRAESVTNLGNTHFYVGRYADAIAAYDVALRSTDAYRHEPWAARRRHLVQVNRAALYQRLGRDEQALEIYRELGAAPGALPVREQAQVLANLGVLYRRLGDPHKAIETYDAALAMFTRDGLLAAELNVMKNRGIALALDLAQLDAARRTFSDSLARATAAGNRREVLQAQLYRAETTLRAGLADVARQDFAASLDAARAMGTPEDEWKALFGLGRIALAAGDPAEAAAHLERAVAVIEGIREAIRIPTLRSDFFTDKREVYDALIAAVVDSAPPDRLFNLIERSHSRAWREHLGLSGSVALPAVQAALPEHTALVEFWNSPMGSAAVLVTRTRADVARVQVDAAAIARLLEALSAGASARRSASTTDLSPALPFAIPDDIRHLIVVPDGALALVPFELLPSGGKMLIERVAVSYAPTAAVLLRAERPQPRLIPPWSMQVRAFGDPAFDEAAMDDVSHVRGRLTASGEEVRGIASELAGRAALHVGADNRKAHLYEGNVPPILHIATHAVADANAMEQSRILFSPARDRAPGADYLFLKEAYDLKLEGVELAVLSACDTERGRLLRGEGVQSFSRAFLAAGARSTVTTLWRVPDAPTASFMKTFYHHLQRGETRAEALRLAKLRFLGSGSTLSDPHYWAAFVLTGDGGHPIPRAIPWSVATMWAAAVAVVVAAAAFGARRIRSRGPHDRERHEGAMPSCLS